MYKPHKEIKIRQILIIIYAPISHHQSRRVFFVPRYMVDSKCHPKCKQYTDTHTHTQSHCPSVCSLLLLTAQTAAAPHYPIVRLAWRGNYFSLFPQLNCKRNAHGDNILCHHTTTRPIATSVFFFFIYLFLFKYIWEYSKTLRARIYRVGAHVIYFKLSIILSPPK